MASSFRISSLVPGGLVVESVIESDDIIKVTTRSCASEALCPSCRSMSRQVHSRDIRQVADLPCTGRGVALSLIARRFFCRAANCGRQIFAERFAEHETIVLSEHDRAGFFDALINPPASSERLQRAFEDHKRRVVR